MYYPNLPPLINYISQKKKENSIIASAFIYTTNLSNITITADANAHFPLWFLLTKGHRGEMIEDIWINFNRIILTKTL